MSAQMSQQSSTLSSRSAFEAVEDLEGQTIGGYRLLRELGRGATGIVYLGIHETRGDSVAVKMFGDDKAKEINREVGLLQSLNHPNIIRCFGRAKIADRGIGAAFLEVCTGGELLNYVVDRQRLDESEARGFARQIVTAVKHCHDQHIYHRDLKLENVLLDANNNCKIIDFSFSRQANLEDGKREKLTTFCGSPAYAAPEIMMFQDYEGPEVDVWSLGVVIFSMVVGDIPFDGPKDIVMGNYVVPKHIELSADLLDLLNRIFETTTAKRITVDGIIDHPWINEGCEVKLRDIVIAQAQAATGLGSPMGSPKTSPMSSPQTSMDFGEMQKPLNAAKNIMRTESMSSSVSSTSQFSVGGSPVRKWKIICILPTEKRVRAPFNPHKTVGELVTYLTSKYNIDGVCVLTLDEDQCELPSEEVVEDALLEGEVVRLVRESNLGGSGSSSTSSIASVDLGSTTSSASGASMSADDLWAQLGDVAASTEKSQSEIDMEKVIAVITDPNDGLLTRDRVHRGRTYLDTFTGAEAVDFLLKCAATRCKTRREAVGWGKRLRSLKVFRAVNKGQSFKDNEFLFQFDTKYANAIHEHKMALYRERKKQRKAAARNNAMMQKIGRKDG